MRKQHDQSPPHAKATGVRGKALAFDGKWYAVEVVRLGPRSLRVVSIAGEVSRDVQIVLRWPRPTLAGLRTKEERMDAKADVLEEAQGFQRQLESAGYRNVKIEIGEP